MTTSHSRNQAKIDLTAALRGAAGLGLHEGVCNHFSLALPTGAGEQTFLINPQGVHWSGIPPSDFVGCQSSRQPVIESKQAPAIVCQNC